MKCMRGLLFCYMRQAEKVGVFIYNNTIFYDQDCKALKNQVMSLECILVANEILLVIKT